MHCSELKNGIRLAILERPTAPTVAVSVWIGSGVADEPGQRSGLAHLTEHMLFRGSVQRKAEQIAPAIEAVGGEINAWTSLDNIVIDVRVPPASLRLALDVVADMLQPTAIDELDLDHERDVVLEELACAKTDPERLFGRALFAQVFRGHPYQRAILGSERSLRHITAADVERFVADQIAGPNVVVVIAGNVTADVARPMCEDQLEGLASSFQLSRRPQLAAQRSIRERLLVSEDEVATVSVVFPIGPMRQREQLLADMAAISLGQGASSRFGRRLERTGRVLGATAYLHTFRDAGLFITTAKIRLGSTDQATHVVDVVDTLASTLFEATHENLRADEFAKAQNAIASDSVYTMETTTSAAASIGSVWSNTGDPNFARTAARWAGQSCRSEMTEVLRGLLAPSRANIIGHIPDSCQLASGTLQTIVTSAARRTLPKRQNSSRLVGAHTLRSRSGTGQKQPRRRQVERVKLASGCTLMLRRDSSVPLVATRACWSGGLDNENSENSGVGTALARALRRGFGGRHSDDIERWLDETSSSFSAHSGRTSFSIHGEWLAGSHTAGLELLFDCILDPHFEANDVARVVDELRDEAGERERSVAHAANSMLMATLFHGHPFALDPAGTERSLRTTDSDALRVFMSRHYPLDQMTLAIVGDFDLDRTVAIIESRTAGLPALESGRELRPRRKPRVLRELPTDATERTAALAIESDRAHVLVGHRGTSIADPDRLALEACAAILGGQSGRLFSRLREQMGLVYRVSAHSIEGIDTGVFAVETQSSAENAAVVTNAIGEELAALGDGDISTEELARAVHFLGGAHNRCLEKRSSLAGALALAGAHDLGEDSIFGFERELGRLTVENVVGVAKRFLNPDCAAVAAVIGAGKTLAAMSTRRSQAPAAARAESSERNAS